MSFQRKLFALYGSWCVTCQVWESVPRNLSWACGHLQHGAVLQFFTTKAYLDQACWRSDRPLWCEMQPLSLASILTSAQRCDLQRSAVLSEHSLLSLQNSTDSLMLPSLLAALCRQDPLSSKWRHTSGSRLVERVTTYHILCPGLCSLHLGLIDSLYALGSALKLIASY